MAIFRSNAPVDMSAGVSFYDVYNSAIVSLGPSLIILNDPYGDRQEYVGNFSYDEYGIAWSESKLTGLRQFFGASTLYWSALDLDIPGTIYYSYAYWGDGDGLVSYALRGNDSIYGSSLSDILLGHDGNDYLIGGGGPDSLRGGNGSDNLQGGAGGDLLEGEEGDDLLNGGLGADSINGGIGNDILYGGSSSDSLRGGAGNDAIYAGAGKDILSGDIGADTLTGGGGTDVFIFDRPSAFGAAASDYVTDFSSAEGDRIEISASSFGILPSSGTSSLITTFTTIELETALASQIPFTYDISRGWLYWNQNGSAEGFGSGGVFAIFRDTPDITAADLTII